MATPVEALADHRCASWHDTNVMIAVDYSASMAGWKAELARDFAVAVIDELSLVGHLERAGGVAFPDLSPMFPLPLSAANRATLRVALLGTASNGNTTPLHDAIVDASTYLQQVSVPGSKILLVVTDGEDNGSVFTALDATAALASAAAWKLMVFAGEEGDTGYTALQQIAGDSGSVFVSADSSAAITALVDRVLAEACANFHPHAQIALSDDELHLGIEGISSIAFDGSASSDHENSPAQLSYTWTFTRPDGSQSTQSGAQVSLSFTDQMLALGEDWNAQLQVSDPSGGSDTAQRGFRIVGSAPNIQVTGDTSVTVGQPILLQAAGEDPDGGAVSFSWDIVASPSRSTHTLQAGFRTQAQLNLPTESADIGEWQFRVTATDNEGDSSAPELVDVEVVNLPPRIELTGPPQVSVGQTIRIETAVIEDDDGGDLAFRWDIVQAPQGAGAAVQEGFAEGSGAGGAVLTYNTTDQDAGSWIFRLVATDDDQAADSETEAEFVVLVDAPPNATIDGPTLIGSSAFPLVLDGAGSVDPDSPCPQQPDRCHDTLDGRPVSVPDDSLRFTWALVEIPGELTDSYTVGTADDALGLYAHNPELSIDYGLLEPGDWTFELTVTDGEGNSDTAEHTVSIADENGHPTAVVSGPRRYIVSSGNILSRDIVLTGIGSYDRDNILNGELLGDGVGITRYDWEVLEAPPGCAPPTLPGGPEERTITPWHAGDSVPPACQGIWRIHLTVTDDDTSSVTDFAETLVGIGNCPDPLCIDYPTAARPQFIEFVRGTRVEIGYHLDSTIYTAPQFGAGLVAQLAIYHESDLTTPVYVAHDANVLATDRGAQLKFHWDGRDGSGANLRPGRYSAEIKLLDARLGDTLFAASELDSIIVAVAEPEILATSDRYVDYAKLLDGTTTVTLDYAITGAALVDRLRWRVFNVLGTLVHADTAAVAQTGTVNWNGIVDGATISAGLYHVEFEALRGGASLGASDQHTLIVYRLEIEPAGGLGNATPPGGFVMVNSDDDNQNNIVDSSESFATETDLVEFSVVVEPLELEGHVTLETSAPGSLKLWDSQAKGAETALATPIAIPANTIPPKLFLEGLAGGASALSLNLQTTDGATLGPFTMAVTGIQIQTMEDSDNDTMITAADASAQFVRIGLWDRAFRTIADANGAVGTLFNQPQESQNFVGRDSRRFYFRIIDPTANTDPTMEETISFANFEWFTVGALWANDDYPPNNRSLTLTETGTNTGVFVSRAVMLVPDLVDANQATHDGLTAGAVRVYDQHDHRTRRITGIDGSVVAAYTPNHAGAPTFALTTPVFRRQPDERWEMNVRIYNFSDFANRGISPIPITTINDATAEIRDRLAPAGVRANVIHTPATDTIDLPMGSPVDLNSVTDFALSGSAFNTLTPSADQTALIALARAIEPSSPANENTLYVIYIGEFSGGAGGQSFPDGWSPPTTGGRNFVFVAGRRALTVYTPAHEIGHMLLNETLTVGEAFGTDPGWANGGHYGGTQDAFNLMRHGTIVSTPKAVTDSRRLWDDTAVHSVRQIGRLRNSRFVVP